MPDAQEARLELGQSFMRMLEEIDEDNVTDPVVIADLNGRIAEAFADWQTAHGITPRGAGA